eukprot:Rhum_TRINITY_DN14126_c0_g1::Rhum_TRINITY_DN14126_c0_g1_i2::g.69894::m.69894
MRLALAVLAPVCALASFSDLASHDSTPAVLPQGESVMMHSTTGEEAAILSDPLPSSDWSLAVDVLRHDMFGTNYEGHLVLFLAPDTAGLDDVATNDNAFDTFLNTMVATLQVRIHATSAHTWLRVRIGDVAYEIDVLHRLTTGGVRISREGSFVRCQYRLPGTSSWVDIGAGGELAAGTRESSLRAGVRVRREWLSSYLIQFVPTIAPASLAVPWHGLPTVHRMPQSYVFASTTGEEAALITGCPLSGDVSTAVDVLRHDMFGTNYEGHLVLFLAPDTAVLDDVATNDNAFDTFLNTMVATLQVRIHATSAHTWLR